MKGEYISGMKCEYISHSHCVEMNQITNGI